MIKTYLETLYPGSFMSEVYVSEVSSRDIASVLAALPPQAFAFRFFDRTEQKQGKEVLKGNARDFSGFYYIGKEYSLEEVERDFKDEQYDILRSNMRGNGYARAVLCHTGNWRPLGPEDVVIPAKARGEG